MNNAELAETLVTNHAMTKADARKAVDDLIAAIVAAAGKGEEVSLAGFGKFKVKDSAAREGRNPATGDTIQIAASRKLTFAPARAVMDALNGDVALDRLRVGEQSVAQDEGRQDGRDRSDDVEGGASGDHAEIVIVGAGPGALQNAPPIVTE